MVATRSIETTGKSGGGGSPSPIIVDFILLHPMTAHNALSLPSPPPQPSPPPSLYTHSTEFVDLVTFPTHFLHKTNRFSAILKIPKTIPNPPLPGLQQSPTWRQFRFRSGTDVICKDPIKGARSAPPRSIVFSFSSSFDACAS